MRRLFFVFFLFLFAHPVSSQDTTQNIPDAIHILGKRKDSKIMLRWAPSTPELWRLGNEHGYILERRTISKQGDMRGDDFQPKKIKVYSKEAIEIVKKQDERLEVIKTLIHDAPYALPLAEDDPYTIIQKTKELDAYFTSFLLVCDFCPACAQAGGLAWTDSTAKIEEDYAYRISLASEIKYKKIESGICVISAGKSPPLLSPQNFEVDFRDKYAVLSWDTELDRGVYTGYWVERSENGEAFQKIHKSPFVYTSEIGEVKEAYYVDSLAQNNKNYYYRLRGVTAFGEDGEPSRVVKGHGRENINGLVTIDSVKVKDKKKVVIYWNIDPEAAKKIKGFEIRKRTKNEEPFRPITKRLLSPKQTNYTDLSKDGSNYYEVAAVSKEGDVIGRSFPSFALIPDETPPIPPKNLVGRIDKDGIVTLFWANNKEKDIQGYRVFRANTSKEEFAELTEKLLTINGFRDTVNINTLSHYVYYKVVATDLNYNPSDYSKVLVLRRPDKIPPSPPVFTNIGVQGDELVIEWAPSTSDDVMEYALSRQTKEDTSWVKIKSWKASQIPQKWTEKSPVIVLGGQYKYKLVVSDSSKNASQAISLLQIYETGVRPSVTITNAIVNRDERFIQIEWDYEDIPVSRCLIYRITNDGQGQLYETIDGNPKKFRDKNLQINNTYTYQIQLVFKNGMRNIISKPSISKY